MKLRGGKYRAVAKANIISPEINRSDIKVGKVLLTKGCWYKLETKFNRQVGFSDGPIVAVKFCNGNRAKGPWTISSTQGYFPQTQNWDKEENITVVDMLKCKLQIKLQEGILRRIIVWSRIGEIPTYGILEGAQETWTMVELGTRSTSESVDVGNSSPKVACACALLGGIKNLSKRRFKRCLLNEISDTTSLWRKTFIKGTFYSLISILASFTPALNFK